MSVYVPPVWRSGCTSECSTCDHKARPEGGYCYMFRQEPEGRCFKHTKAAPPVGVLESLIASAAEYSPHFRKEQP